MAETRLIELYKYRGLSRLENDILSIKFIGKPIGVKIKQFEINMSTEDFLKVKEDYAKINRSIPMYIRVNGYSNIEMMLHGISLIINKIIQQ